MDYLSIYANATSFQQPTGSLLDANFLKVVVEDVVPLPRSSPQRHPALSRLRRDCFLVVPDCVPVVVGDLVVGILTLCADRVK